jgi:DNA-binding NtrC family response regulator
VLGRVAYSLGETLADLVRAAGQPGLAVPTGAASRLGLSEIAQAIADLPARVGSKVDAMISATVLYAMAVSGDNQSAAARLLGMERKAFVRRVQRARRKR